jgi:hypothetical protein
MNGLVVDWWTFAMGGFLIWAALSASWRQLRTGVARDGEQLGANRYARKTHPVVYWSLLAVNLLALALGGWLIGTGLGVIE